MKDLLLITAAIATLVFGVNAIVHGYTENYILLQYVGGALLGAFVNLIWRSK